MSLPSPTENPAVVSVSPGRRKDENSGIDHLYERSRQSLQRRGGGLGALDVLHERLILLRPAELGELGVLFRQWRVARRQVEEVAGQETSCRSAEVTRIPP